MTNVGMIEYDGSTLMPQNTHEHIQERLQTIREGMVDAIRLEVERRRALGLPVYVYENGRVIDANAKRNDPESN